jgi:cytochrome c-type biogenesis protein CcmH/NrfG
VGCAKVVEYSNPIYGRANNVIYLASNVGLPLFFLLLFALPVTVLVLILPLRAIHTKMVSEAKTNENSYFIRTEALREEIQALLATKQVEAAKAVQEEKALVETLYAPYPTWPFRFRSKISSTVLEVGGSLLIGLITAAVVQYFFPVILTLFIRTP